MTPRSSNLARKAGTPSLARQVLWVALGLCASGTALALCSPSTTNRPVCPAAAAAEAASFIDPTASIASSQRLTLDKQVYIGPFAAISASGTVSIGKKTNLQDSVGVTGSGTVTLGDEVILAHGAQVRAPSRVGRKEVVGEHNAAFVGFNSLIDRATVEHDAMVLHLARVAPGIVIKHGKVVLSGKNITTQAEADNVALGKVVPITEALREFMEGVLHVNETFAREYTNLFRDNASNVRGINFDPGRSDFNPVRDLPTLAGVATRDPSHRNRIIGDVSLADSRDVLNADDDEQVVGNFISLRADEGEPFHVGHIARMRDRTTFHALEHTGLHLHDHVNYGFRSLVHGGQSAATQNNPHFNTVVGDGTRIGDHAVVFRSVLGAGVSIGCGSLVDGSTLPAGTVVPARTIVVNFGHANASTYAVEWNPGCSTGAK